MDPMTALAIASIAQNRAKTSYNKLKRVDATEKKLGSPWHKRALVGVGEFVAGASPTSLIWNPMDWYERNRQGHLNDLEAKARNSTGLSGEGELKKSANATREIMNQQLQQNIGTINQEFAGANRMSSGARASAILQAQNQNSFNLANVVNSMALQESQFARNLEEERAWRQANLDAGQPGLADKVGDLFGLGVQLYGSNPEWFNQKAGEIGNKAGIGNSDLYAPTTSEPALMAPSEFNQINPDTATPLGTATGGPTTMDSPFLQSLLAPPKTEYSPMDLFTTDVPKEQKIQTFVNTPSTTIAESPRAPETIQEMLFIDDNIPIDEYINLALVIPRMTKDEKITAIQNLFAKYNKVVNTVGPTIQNSK